MNVSLRQLKAFLGVAESGNFTKTSQRLHMSQAALSATVRELESQLGSRLFDRTTRNVVLTEAGRALLPAAARIVADIESVSQQMNELGRKDVSEIKVGVTPLMAAHALPEALERFLAASPSVSVKVVDSSPADIQQQVESGQLDAGYGAFFAAASGLTLTPVLKWRLLAASATDHPGLRVPLGWSDLSEHRLIAVNEASPVQQLVDSHLRREGITPLDRWTVNQLETAIALAEKGFGLAVIPSFAAAACRRYAVRLRPIGDAQHYEFSQITRAGRALPPSIDAFAEAFTAVIDVASTTLLAGAD